LWQRRAPALERLRPRHHPRFSMVSATQQSSRIRRRKQTTNGKANKRERRRTGTPAFAVHPEGYDTNAADAKKA
jgi:hypothetical protein